MNTPEPTGPAKASGCLLAFALMLPVWAIVAGAVILLIGR
jgi:hypothetical protein